MGGKQIACKWARIVAMNRVLMIVNPIAGRRRPTRLVERVRHRLTDEGVDVEIRETTGPGDAASWAREVACACRSIIVFGGDGTCREVASGLIGRQTPIVPVPTGTDSVFARGLGMQARVSRIVQAVLHGRPEPFDVGILNGQHRFLVVAGIGFDGAVLQRVARRRRGHQGWLDYVGPLMETLVKYDFPAIRVSDGSAGCFDGRGIVLVGNMARYAWGLRVVRDAVWDDGQLDAVIFPCASAAELIGHAVRTVFRRQVDRGGVVAIRSPKITVACERTLPAQIDGEFIEGRKFEFSAEAGCLFVQRG